MENSETQENAKTQGNGYLGSGSQRKGNSAMDKLKEALLALLEVLAVSLVLATIFLAAMYIQGCCRLWIIRATVDSPLPGWLKTVIWGWW